VRKCLATMPEAIAQKKFSCPTCVAAAEWNPAKLSLFAQKD